MTEENLRDSGPRDHPLQERLRSAANDHDDEETAELLSTAATELAARDARLAELQSELEETNEGMMALTLELEEAERRYRTLFENAVEGIYKTTADGRRYVMTNSSMVDILGYESADDLQNVDVAEDVFVDEERYREYKQTLLETGAVENFEYRVRRADGEIRWVSDNARTLTDEDGRDGFRGGVIDVTDVKKYERQLERKNEELEALNRMVSHDISNDVQVILGYARQVERSVSEELEPTVRNIVEAGENIAELTQNAGEFVDTLAGQNEPELKPTPVAETLSYELDKVRSTHDAARFELTTELPSVSVSANEMLSSVFRNLLTNAVQHHDGDEPHVEIACHVHADDVEVRIADDGPGVPDDVKDRIFSKGEQSVDSDGTGLGLYLVRELVANYGGDVWTEDRDAQRGAVFVVTLPKADGAGGTDEAT